MALAQPTKKGKGGSVGSGLNTVVSGLGVGAVNGTGDSRSLIGVV